MVSASRKSALSRPVRQLELELRKHLLYRHGLGVTPTESGMRLLAHGRGILHQIGPARKTRAPAHLIIAPANNCANHQARVE